MKDGGEGILFSGAELGGLGLPATAEPEMLTGLAEY